MNDLFDGDIIKDFRREGYISKKPSFFFDMDINSHSKLTMGNVSMFFNEIKQQIDSSGVNFKTKINVNQIKSNGGSQEYEYIGEINIYTNLDDIKQKFPYKTKRQNSKDNAMKMCYLYTLMILKQYKYLDCHLKFCKNKVNQ